MPIPPVRPDDRSVNDVAHRVLAMNRLHMGCIAARSRALLLVVAFGMVLVTYSGSLWFNGLHAYSGL